MSTDKLSTIILRFRDLVTDRGQTIAWHKEIIDRSDGHFVWWGWWRKRGETIPDEAFRKLAKKAESEPGGLTAYLMDSGQELLYEVTCTEIKWDPKLAEIGTDEVSLTPEYYNKRKYLAWFKLTSIAEVKKPETVLHRYSYLRVDEFFEDKESHYTSFYNKQVYSVKELRQQDRTIWFLREFESGDPTHEVSLLSARAITPVHFSANYFESQSTALLWLSDTHFSEEGHHGFPLKSTATKSNLAESITRSFKETFPQVAGIIISGDITWRNLPTEFQLATEFIRELTFWSPLQPDQIAICPGNHDLKWSDDPADKTKPIDSVGRDYSQAYAAFYEGRFFIAPNEFLSCGRRFLMGNAIPVDIACLNSSYLQQLKDAFQGHGFIGDKQMEFVASEMNWDPDPDKPRAFRIVVLHHHLIPTTFRATAIADYAYSVVLDAEALSRWIAKYRVDLVLHGHMHQPFCTWIRRPINVGKPEQGWHTFSVIGMGSSGVEGELGEVNKNTVGFLDFKKDALTVSVHSIHSVNPSTKIWEVEVPYKNYSNETSDYGSR
jgi:predicted MPP superfamily phosphohydrolase